MQKDEDAYLPILKDIETGLVEEYRQDPQLTDPKVAYALDAGKVAIKKSQGYAKNQSVPSDPQTDRIVAHCLHVAQTHLAPQGSLSLSELIRCIDRVERSVRRHAAHGLRGYFEFVQDFI